MKLNFQNEFFPGDKAAKTGLYSQAFSNTCFVIHLLICCPFIEFSDPGYLGLLGLHQDQSFHTTKHANDLTICEEWQHDMLCLGVVR